MVHSDTRPSPHRHLPPTPIQEPPLAAKYSQAPLRYREQKSSSTPQAQPATAPRPHLFSPPPSQPMPPAPSPSPPPIPAPAQPRSSTSSPTAETQARPPQRPAITLATVLGPCNQVTASSPIVINEVTTAATAWGLAQFLTSAGNLGASATNTQGLSNAFATVANLVNLTTGTSPGAAFPSTGASPAAKINTLANLLNTCTAAPPPPAPTSSPLPRLAEPPHLPTPSTPPSTSSTTPP